MTQGELMAHVRTYIAKARRHWSKFSVKTRRAFIAIGAGISLVLIILIWRGGAGEARAIERVLAQDRTYAQQRNDAASRGAAASDAIAQYVARMKSLDFSGCPPEFREAYIRHANAWQGMQIQLASEPSGWDAFLTGFLKGLNGQLDGGSFQMEADRKKHLEKIQASWGEVEAIAARHGAHIQP
jgi:hypothetical protein